MKSRLNPFVTLESTALSLSAADWSWSTVQLHRLPGDMWSLVGVVTNVSAGTITAGGAGDITDVTVADPGSLPAGSFPTDPNNLLVFPAHRSGVATWWMRVGTAGAIHLTHGPPTASLQNGAELTIRALWHHPTP